MTDVMIKINLNKLWYNLFKKLYTISKFYNIKNRKKKS